MRTIGGAICFVAYLSGILFCTSFGRSDQGYSIALWIWAFVREHGPPLEKALSNLSGG